MAAAFVAGVVLAVRGFRLAVAYDGEAVLVRGLLRSRRIPRAAVTAVTGFPAVRWRDRRGRTRWTPVIAFAELGASIAAVERHNSRCAAQLRQSLRR